MQEETTIQRHAGGVRCGCLLRMILPSSHRDYTVVPGDIQHVETAFETQATERIRLFNLYSKLLGSYL